MPSSFLLQASLWGQIFEIAVKRGVLLHLIHQKLILDNHPVLEPWQAIANAKIENELVRTLKLTDPNARAWAGTMVRHLLVLGYGLGWTAMRECLKHSPVRQAKLEAIWCPLTLPGQLSVSDEEIEKEKTARAFQAAFNLPGNPDRALVYQGQPGRADFLLWLSADEKTEGNFTSHSARFLTRKENKNKRQKFENLILCLEFSYNAPANLADFSNETPHREEINRYARYIDSRGVFSRVCAEVEGNEFLLSSKLANHLSAFSSSDKPLFKLCQASSYTERLIHLLRVRDHIKGACSARAIAVTSNGFESLAAHFMDREPEAEPRARLMKSLGEAYRNLHKLSDDAPDELQKEISLVFNKLLGSLPETFKQQAKQIKQLPDLGSDLHFLFQENVEGFYSPMQEILRADAIAAVEETEELREFFGGSPQSKFAVALDRNSQQDEQIPLRQVHAAAVVAGLNAARTGKLNVIALEGNPGIGKTTAVMDFLKQQSQGFLFLYVSPRVVINRSVTANLARESGNATGILTLTSNANLITAAPKWYEQQVEKHGWDNRRIDSGVVVDGIEELARPNCSTVFLTPEQEHEIDCNVISSTRYKRSRSERDDSVESIQRPGVLLTLAGAARRLLEVNPQV